MKDYKQFEKKFTIISILDSIKKHLAIFLFIFGYFSVFGVVYSTVITERTYQSTGQITNQGSLTGTYLNTIVNTVKNEDTLEIIASNLSEKKVLHTNGSAITKSYISSGLVFPITNSSSYLNISFVGKEKTILKPVLQEVLEVTVEVIANGSFKDQYKDIRVSNNASDPIDISDTNLKILLFSLVGLGLGIGTAFITDISTDLVYNISDISSLQTNVFELEYTDSKKGEK